MRTYASFSDVADVLQRRAMEEQSRTLNLLRRLAALLKRVEGADDGNCPVCGYCDTFGGPPHAPDCELAALKAELEKVTK